ncbi:uncharacterized protein A4U43_C09F840 [Asparagus officinalis]|uniref:Pollen Ole e 1 allergen and extensin family protein n=1 Tax=Asparagus officinalis TaxID=4686 RepID=A0A5P1E4I5_ASPOF|nr:uncharacterized protein LOC109824112 [Asparagus officinalis]ONK57470.1 uncharacterized protein A4U43_C09F840 [Asparagus officinalis]
MAPHCAAVRVLVLVLALASINLSSCQLVKGSVSCVDCNPHKDLSGVRVAVKCRFERKLVFALTNNKGNFEAEVPKNSSSPSSSPLNCYAMLLGGPVQLWAFKKSMLSKIIKAPAGLSGSYSLSTPLTFFISHPTPKVFDQSHSDDKKSPDFGVFPPMALPPPANFTGNIPLIFFFPFLPIIGVP